MKAKYSVLLAALILVAGVSLAVAASELVTNGDFSNGLTDWTTVTINNAVTASIDNGCGAGVARLEGINGGSLEQCIVVDDIALPAETHWTLSADLRLIDGVVSVVEAQFFNNPNCSGVEAHAIDINTVTPSANLATFTQMDDYDPPPNSSIRLVASSEALPNQDDTACFDNISLIAATPTAVALGSTSAQNGMPSSWAFALLLAAAAILITTFVIVGRRILNLDV